MAFLCRRPVGAALLVSGNRIGWYRRQLPFGMGEHNAQNSRIGAFAGCEHKRATAMRTAIASSTQRSSLKTSNTTKDTIMTAAQLTRARADAARLDAARLEMDSDHAYAAGRLQRARRLAATAARVRAAADGWEVAS
jgi:hypothetical protein